MKEIIQVLVFTCSIASLAISIFMLIKTAQMRAEAKEIEDGNKRFLDGVDAKIELMEKKMKGERVCDGYCQKCKNGVPVNGFLNTTFYECLLDCKCKDFELK